jgi:hypothetical protein
MIYDISSSFTGLLCNIVRILSKNIQLACSTRRGWRRGRRQCLEEEFLEHEEKHRDDAREER